MYKFAENDLKPSIKLIILERSFLYNLNGGR